MAQALSYYEGSEYPGLEEIEDILYLLDSMVDNYKVAQPMDNPKGKEAKIFTAEKWLKIAEVKETLLERTSTFDKSNFSKDISPKLA